VFSQYVADGKMSGSVILVLRRGRIVYSKSFGFRDIDAGIEMTSDTIFRIASQSKAIISVGVMILQERGDLLISDPVGQYLPEFDSTTVAVALDGGGYEVVPADRKISIRDLLTHTSGISYGSGPASELWSEAEMDIKSLYFGSREEPIRETVRRMAELPFAAQPGERFVYGYSSDILGALIEVVSGKSLDVFLTESIFEPLTMPDTHFYLPMEKANRLAVVYSLDASGELTKAADVSKWRGQGQYVIGPRKSFSGGAGLVSTANDYARFLQMLLNRGVLNNTRILSRKTVEHMTVNHTGDLYTAPGLGFGLGFAIQSEEMGMRMAPGSEGEFGWGGAYHTRYWVDPLEELVVTYFTQLLPAGELDDHQKLRTLIYQAIDD